MTAILSKRSVIRHLFATSSFGFLISAVAHLNSRCFRRSNDLVSHKFNLSLLLEKPFRSMKHFRLDMLYCRNLTSLSESALECRIKLCHHGCWCYFKLHEIHIRFVLFSYFYRNCVKYDNIYQNEWTKRGKHRSVKYFNKKLLKAPPQIIILRKEIVGDKACYLYSV